MFRLLFLWVLLFPLFSPPISGQTAANPFELTFRLPKTTASGALADTTQSLPNNPFDVVPHRAPGAAKSLAENATEPFRPFSIVPTGGGLPLYVLFSVVVIMVGFLTFSMATNRAVVGKAWRGFLNDNALTLIQREALGLVGNTPYYLLYANFLLNAGMFIFLVTRFFRKETYNNLSFLLLCIGLSVGIFLFKHVLLNTLAWLFPVQNEVRRYNFLIVVFNCVLGLFLMPCNLILAFTSDYQTLLVFWMLGLVSVFYVYRSIRSTAIGSKFLAVSQFHFLLYLCTVEIAPVLFVIKLAMNQT